MPKRVSLKGKGADLFFGDFPATPTAESPSAASLNESPSVTATAGHVEYADGGGDVGYSCHCWAVSHRQRGPLIRLQGDRPKRSAPWPIVVRLPARTTQAMPSQPVAQVVRHPVPGCA